MNRGFKVLTTVLILVVGVLAISSGFLYAKTTTLEQQLKSDETTNDNAITSTPTPQATVPIKTESVSEPDSTTTTAPTTTTPTTTPTTTSTTPKSGTAGTYTVVAGDTMYSIGLKLKINWLDLAKANGLDETTANKIKIGQVLTLPK